MIICVPASCYCQTHVHNLLAIINYDYFPFMILHLSTSSNPVFLDCLFDVPPRCCFSCGCRSLILLSCCFSCCGPQFMFFFNRCSCFIKKQARVSNTIRSIPYVGTKLDMGIAATAIYAPHLAYCLACLLWLMHPPDHSTPPLPEVPPVRVMFVACFSHFNCNHASVSRRSTVPTTNRCTSNI